MIEVTGKNIWSFPAQAYVITTNGTRKQDGSCVMGRGIAAQAKAKFKGIDKQIGDMLVEGNAVYWLGYYTLTKENRRAVLITYPVKHNWWGKADLDLIKESAKQLAVIVDANGLERVAMPRPGCGNGKLEWDDVRRIIKPILDNRFYVVERGRV